jgi:hypothetical protein
MLLDRFSYYFSVKGREGGIFSLDFEFLPDGMPAEQNNVEAIKRTIKNNFSDLESLLETLLSSNSRFNVEKKPVLTDSPYSLEAGYEYAGKCKNNLAKIGALIKMILPISGIVSKPGIRPVPIGPFTQITATLSYRILKHTVDKNSAIITLKLTLGHDLNLSLFNTIVNLPRLNFSQQAQREIKHLQSVLAMGENINPQKQLDVSLFLKE